MRRRVRQVTLVALACALSACAAYRPIALREAPGAGEVRVRLTELGSAELSAVVGPSTVALDGRVREAGDTVVVGLVQTVTRDGALVTWRGEAVRVPAAWVAGVERRASSRGRTALLAGGIAAAVVALGAGFGGNGTALGAPRTGTGPGR